MSNLDNNSEQENFDLAGKTEVKLYFLLQGVGSLLSFNAIITAIDFFQNCFKDYDYSFLFGIPFSLASLIFSFLVFVLIRLISLDNRINISLGSMGVLLIVICISSQLLQNAIGFWISMLIIFLLSTFTVFQQASVWCVAGVFPNEMMTLIGTGTGFSGILLSLLRLFFTSVLGTDGEGRIFLGALLFFICSGLIFLTAIISHIRMKKNKYFMHFAKKLATLEVNKIRTRGESNLLVAPFEENTFDNTIEEAHHTSRQKEGGGSKLNKLSEAQIAKVSFNHAIESNKFSFKNIIRICKNNYIMPICILLSFIQTLMLYPGMCLKRKITGLDDTWNAVVIVLIFNIFDTIGKYLTKYRSLYNNPSTVVLLIGRFIFYLTLIKIATDPNVYVMNTDWFIIVNLIVFALSNGFLMTASMVLSIDNVQEERDKEAMGTVVSLMINLGCVIASFACLSLANVG